MTREEMRERVARALCWNRAGPACDCRARGIPCRGLVENLLDESSEFSKQADAAIALVLEEVLNLCIYQNEYDDSVSSHAEFMTCARISFAVHRLLENVKNG